MITSTDLTVRYMAVQRRYTSYELGQAVLPYGQVHEKVPHAIAIHAL
jgi:hypothetical protein